MTEPAANKTWVRISTASDAILGLAATFAAAAVIGFTTLGSLPLGLAASVLCAAALAYYGYAQSFVAINRQAVTLRQPLHTERHIDWQDVRYVLTDRDTYVFIGANSSLAVRLGGRADGDTLRTFINDLTRARGIPVSQTRTRPSARAR